MAPLLAQRQRTDRTFERLYRRHVGDVYRYALAVMRNQPDAEDVTQTTFMNAYRAFREGERPEKAHNWLIAIAHNVCRQRFRQTARRPVEVAFDDDVATSLVETEDTPTGDDIRRALRHLAFSQRAALVMRELEGRSYAEIADILGLSTSAVETLIFRARRALREQLESTLTCAEAELAISKQLDGRLSRAEKGFLRAHLRECPECATFARRQRAQRTALRSLAAIPVPPWLGSLFGGGGASVGGGLAVKAAVAVTAGVAIGGAGYVGVHDAVKRHHPAGAAADPATSTLDAASPSALRRAPVVAPAAFVAAPATVRSVHSRHSGRSRPAGRGVERRRGYAARHGRGHQRPHAFGRARGHANAAQIAHVHPRPHPQHVRVTHANTSHLRAIPSVRTKPQSFVHVHGNGRAHAGTAGGNGGGKGHAK